MTHLPSSASSFNMFKIPVSFFSSKFPVGSSARIILGLFAGYFLNYFIIGTCEINILRFAKVIKPISYVFAILITIIFTAIVNFITYFALKKINMIESLKSIE